MTLAHLGGRVRHPAPENQLYKLGYNEVSQSYVKISPWQHIHNGVDWDGLLCMATAGKVCLDAHSGGRIVTSPGRIHDLQSDQQGGIGVDDVQDAWLRGWNAVLVVPSAFDRADVLDAVNDRRNVIVGMNYTNFPYKAQSGSFDHALNFDDLTSSTRGLFYDSLRTMPFWGAPDALLDAAESLAMRVRGTKSRLFVGYSAVRPLLSAAAPHYKATTTRKTSLYNPETKRWTFVDVAGPADNRIAIGTRLEVRGVQYEVGGARCYPVSSGTWSALYAGYYVPVVNVKLSGKV